MQVHVLHIVIRLVFFFQQSAKYCQLHNGTKLLLPLNMPQ